MQQVSIIDVSLKLLSIKRSALRAHMYEVVRCLAFKHELASEGQADPFFNLTLNAVELSIFADADLIDKIFLDTKVAQDGSSSHQENGSPFQAGIEVSEDTWIPLQVEGHDDEGEMSGIRLRNISAPLAAAGISILFLSTYISDFLLIKRHRLELVVSILKREHFMSADGDEGTSSQIGGSPAPYFQPLEESHLSVTPGSSGGGNSLPSQLPRSLTRSTSSLVKTKGHSSETHSTEASPARSSQSQNDASRSRTSSLSRSRPSFGEFASSGFDSSSPAVLPPAFQSPPVQSRSLDALDEEEAQPRSFEKMQESIMSDSSTASGIVDKISLLPDEVVCVGLNMQQEHIWRAKIIHALYYTEDVLPRASVQNKRGEALEDADEAENQPTESLHSSQLNSRSSSRQSQLHLYSTTPTPHRPAMSIGSNLTPARSFSASTQESQSQPLFAVTEEAAYPTPFLSLTLTNEGGSLMSDIRLLRKLFGDSDEAVVYAPGGGLSHVWSGELDEDDEDSSESDAGDDIASLKNMSLGRGRPLGRRNSERENWDVFDESEEWEPVSASKKGGEEETEDEKRLFASGRRLFKCLQLDLSSFGLEKAGLAHQFATLITKEQINLLYSATFRTANILVAKRHIRKARDALESASR